MRRFAIATAGDDNYLPILQGLIRSIRAKPQGFDVPIAVLDIGLGEVSKAWLAQHGAICIPVGWDFPFPKQMPEYLKAMISRPHLPKYIQGVRTIVWLDADTWVQRWDAIELLLQGADATGFAIVAECDRSYTPIYEGKPYATNLYEWYNLCFNETVARELFLYPLLNCGVLAGRVDAPHWKIWADLLHQSLQQVTLFVSEQTALNVALRTRGLRFSQLPATCNWICYRAPPLCSQDGSTLLTPEIPHEPLGIVHLAGYHYNEKNKPFALSTQDGGSITRPLTWIGPA